MNTNFDDSTMEYEQATQNRFAGFWIRFGAFFIDAIILSIPTAGVGFMFIPDFNWFNAGEYKMYNFLSLIINWLYYAGMESSRSQGTLGKIALNIKVCDEYGNRLQFAQATLRYFSKLLSALIFLLGFIMAAFDRCKQALHDKLAKTYVLHR